MDLSLRIPKTFFDNFEIVCKYQNIQLINAICEWKGWGEDRAEEIKAEFFNDDPSIKKTIKQSKIRIPEMSLESNESKPKTKKLVRKKPDSEVSKTIYIQREMIFEDKSYLVEEPSDNVYDKVTGKFVGVIYFVNGISKINRNAGEN